MVVQARSTEVTARPSPLRFRTDTAAVVVVDMQNDFASPGGMFDRAGIDVRDIQAIVAPTARLLDAARAAGLLVVYLKMGFRPDLSDAGGPDSPTWLKHVPFGIGTEICGPDGAVSRILIGETWNTDIVDGLQPHETDEVIYTNRYSGFYGTGLFAWITTSTAVAEGLASSG